MKPITDPCEHYFSQENIQIFHDKGILVIEKALPLSLIKLLSKDSRGLFSAGSFRNSGIGHSREHHINQAIRSDTICWWDAETLVLVQQRFWRFMEDLRLAFNRHMYLGLFDSELHYATYQVGAFYKPHLDQFQKNNLRQISLVLFLNPNWLDTDGGALRLYEDDGIGFRDVIPRAGVLVLFSSARVLHEVLPTHRLRRTLTGWMRTRPATII